MTVIAIHIPVSVGVSIVPITMSQRTIWLVGRLIPGIVIHTLRHPS